MNIWVRRWLMMPMYLAHLWIKRKAEYIIVAGVLVVLVYVFYWSVMHIIWELQCVEAGYPQVTVLPLADPYCVRVFNGATDMLQVSRLGGG